MENLYEHRTLYRVPGDIDTTYPACIFFDDSVEDVVWCDLEIVGGHMLCPKHERQVKASGLLVNYPGDYLDDATGDGNTTLVNIASWLYSLDADLLFKKMDELGYSYWLEGKDTSHLGFGGYRTWDEGICADCGKAFGSGGRGTEHHGRGLCESCYKYLSNNHPERLDLYPTRRYVNNVTGHAHFMLTYHPEIMSQVGSFYYGVTMNRDGDGI